MAKLSDSAFTTLFADNRLRVKNILERPQWKLREKKVALWNFFLAREVESGSYFLVTEPDHDLYIVLGLTGATMILPAAGRGGMAFFAYLHQRYGLSEREDTAKFLYDTLRLYIYQHGDHVELRRFSIFNRTNSTAYLSGYDGGSWRCDGQTVERITNGEDGVFFADDDGGQPCVPDVAPHGLLLDTLTSLNFAALSPGGMTPVHQQRALTVWFFALAFPDLMPTKPLLIVEGAPGSGKSSAVQLLQLALMGMKRPIILQKSKEDDFGIILLRSPVCVLDNLDSFIDWLPDAVCAYATSGQWTRRRLYTDNEEVTIRPHAFIAVASKNPTSFRREDTADRCIVLRLERRKTFTRQQRLEANILEHRNKLFGEYLYYVNQIVDAIRAGAFEDSVDEANRMADFAAMARVVGRVLEWSEEEIEDLLAALQHERDAFINEGDSLTEILHKWITYRTRGVATTNVGREISLNQLFAELETLSEAASLPFYKTPQVLAQKLRSPHLESEFIVQMLHDGKQQSYKIWRLTDARLTVVKGR
jgi:hypothetical protein